MINKIKSKEMIAGKSNFNYFGFLLNWLKRKKFHIIENCANLIKLAE